MIILNGKLYAPGDPEATFLNRSFRYGDGLFETIRIHNGHPLSLDSHLARMTNGMKALKFEFQADSFAEKITSELRRMMEISGIDKHGKVSLRIFRSGEGNYKPISHSPYYLLEGYALKDDYFQSKATYTLTEYTDISLNSNLLSPFKTTSALPYVMAAIHAEEKGFDESVLYCNGYVSETSSSNIFIIEKQKILTPPLSAGCVDGIMRKRVIRLAGELKLNFAEKKLKSRDLSQADEIFLTNSMRGIMPVRQWKDQLLDVRAFTMVPFLKNCLMQMVNSETKK
ncbi:MAG: aminotransferase class IV [Bacteroidia bacterium]